MKPEEYALTTVDNPYNPYKDFDGWLRFDMDHGYGTCNYLARVSFESPAFTDEENIRERNRAIDEIIEIDPIGLYKKIYPNDKVIPLPTGIDSRTLQPSLNN